MNFIDTHIHCIPNVDDGSQSMNDSIEMLNLGVKQGISNFFCTVHSEMINDADDDVNIYNQYLKMIDEYQEQNERTIKSRVITEIHINKGNFNDCLVDGEINPLFREINKNYYLFEFDYKDSSENIIQICKELRDNDIIPVIAHAERYINILDAIDSLKEMGCIIQVNIGSFVRGGFLAYVDTSIKLLKENKIDILGTDAHRINWRPPIINDGISIIENLVTKKKLEDICYNNAIKLFNL